MHIKNYLHFLFLIQIFLLNSCSSVWNKKFKDNEAMMYGMVYDENDEALKEVEVRVDGKLKAITDIQGRFILKYVYGNILEKTKHKIQLQKEGYETINEEIFYDPMSLLYFNMQSANYILGLAEKLIDNENYETANKEIHRLLKIESKKDIALYMLAILNIKKQNFNEAILILEKMKNMNNPYIKKLLEKIR